jgi:MFS family permease
MVPNERRILFYTCAAHAFTHVYMGMYAAVLGRMAVDLGISIEEVTASASIATTCFGLGALPAGWLADRFGEKPLLVGFFFLTAVGGAVVGVAPSAAALGGGMGLLGLGTSIFHPVGNSMIARGIRSPERAMGTNGFWGSIGEAAGPLVAVLVAALASWRGAYLGLLAPMALLGTLLALSPLEIPRPMKDSPRGETASEGGGPQAADRRAGLRKFPTTIVFLFAAMAFGGVEFWIVKTMLPLHLERGMRETSLSLLGAEEYVKAGIVTALVYAVGGLGQYAAGHLLERRSAFRLYVEIFIVGAPLIFLTGRLSGWPLLGTAAVMAVVMFAPQAVENTILARVAPPRWQGMIYGLKFVLTFGIGGIGPYLSGWVEGAHGTGAAFSLAAMFSAGAGLLAAATLLLRTRTGLEGTGTRPARDRTRSGPERTVEGR